jgi:putative ABC transport system permease protein
MNNLWQDFRYGLRTLLRNPGFTLVAVITLGLGIGANSAVFSVVNAVLIRPLPYNDPERLVMVWETNPSLPVPYMFASPPNFADWRDQQKVFEEISAFDVRDINLVSGDEAERLQGSLVSANIFSLLGVNPALGRGFQAGEDDPAAQPVAIISHGLWQRRFGSSNNIIGETISLDSQSYTVIGVMPRGFDFPPPVPFAGVARDLNVEVWTPLRTRIDPTQRGAHYLHTIARLKQDTSIEQAKAGMATIAEQLAQSYPESNEGWNVTLFSLPEQVSGNIRAALLVLLGAVGFVLLIGCANVANLLLSRAVARHREIAIRSALGANRLRIIGQLLVESALLSIAGGIAGLVLASEGLKLLIALAPKNIPMVAAASIDSRVVIFTLFVSLLTAILFGLAPALQASRINLIDTLKEGGRGASEGGRRILRNSLIVAEVALSLLLLIGAGLLFRSFMQLQNVPLGFQPENVTTMGVNLPRAVYQRPQERAQFIEQLIAKISVMPGIQSAGAVDSLPLGAKRQGTGIIVEGEPPLPGEDRSINFSYITPGYFRAMGIQLQRGRDITEADKADSKAVAIISNIAAERYFPNEDPIGKRVSLGFRSQTMFEIIGIVTDERHSSLQASLRPNVYVPYSQVPGMPTMTIAVRSPQAPSSVAAAVREQLRSLDSRIPIYDVKTMNDVIANAASQPRFSTFLLTVFATAALLLAGIGIYGVMAYSVTQRTQEIGIRLALGAQRADVFKLVLGHGLKITLIGITLGIAASFALTRFMSSLLFGVSDTDPLTFISVSLLLTAVSLVACYVPARRATRVDPIVALRHE